jgi:type II restriction/modification system DNA methylase subunit YeeA
MRAHKRYLVTPRVALHRLFVWLDSVVIPDSRAFGFIRSDDTFFGVLHSRFHEAWTFRTCSWHGVGNDPTYNSAGVFETFPFPDGLTPNVPANHYADDPRAIAIAKAARRLDELRNAWLNPPDFVRIEQEIAPGYPDRVLPKDTVAAVTLRERTLTNLYNHRPQWLVDAHRDLDVAVAAAYGWAADISEEDALARLLALNLSRTSVSEPMTIHRGVKRHSRSVTPEEARRSPQFKLPIAGGKQVRENAPATLVPIEQTARPKGHSPRKRNSA